MDTVVLITALVTFFIVFFTYLGFEAGNRYAEIDGLACSICNKRIKHRKKMLAKAEKIKAKKRKK